MMKINKLPTELSFSLALRVYIQRIGLVFLIAGINILVFFLLLSPVNLSRIFIVAIVSILIILVQRYWYKKKVDKLIAEMDRIGREKSEPQERLAGQSLRHSTSSNKNER